MKKIFTILMLVPAISFAQNCKYDVNTYDKFLKISKLEKDVKVHKANGVGDGYLKLTFCKYDSSVFFRITLIRQDGIVIGTQDAVMFLMDDGSTVKAYPDQIYSSSMRMSTNQEVLNATYKFETSIEPLKEKAVQSIRIYYNSVYSDYSIKDKFSKDLQQTAKCF